MSCACMHRMRYFLKENRWLEPPFCMHAHACSPLCRGEKKKVARRNSSRGARALHGPSSAMSVENLGSTFFLKSGVDVQIWRDRTGQKLVEGAKLCCAADSASLKLCL